jgi:radical SAM superfamily enzyme YgiQ (UPF0313 family)
MKIALVIAPLYSQEFAPLGLAYLNAVLRKAGHETTPWDLEFLMQVERPGLYGQLNTRNRWAGVLDSVNYLIQPELVLAALFRPEEQLKVTDDRDQFIMEAREYAGRLAGRILAEQPEAVLLSTFLANMLYSLMVAKEIKAREPLMPVVLGGPGVSDGEVREIILRLGMADGCVVGEGEDTVIELIDAMDGAVPKDAVPGVSHLKDGKLCFTPRQGRVDLDRLPPPDFQGFPFPGATIRQYLRVGFGGLPIAASRGCPARCVFCSEKDFWGGHRARSVDAVVGEMAYLKETYEYDLFYFCDSLINADRRWLERLCDALIESGLEIFVTFAYCRPMKLDRPLLKKMDRAGFRKLDFGVESGSPSVLRRMGKGNVREEALGIIVAASEVMASVEANIMAFFPGESQEETLESIRFIFDVYNRILAKGLGEDTIPTWSFNWLQLMPQSQLYRERKRFGIALEPYSIDFPPPARHVEPLIERILLKWRDPEVDMEEKLFRTTLFTACPSRTWDNRYRRSLLEKVASLLRESSRFRFKKNYKVLEVLRSSQPGDEGRRYVLQDLDYLFAVGPVEEETIRGLRRERSVGEMEDDIRRSIGSGPDLTQKVRHFLALLLCLEIVSLESSSDMLL